MKAIEFDWHYVFIKDSNISTVYIIVILSYKLLGEIQISHHFKRNLVRLCVYCSLRQIINKTCLCNCV